MSKSYFDDENKKAEVKEMATVSLPRIRAVRAGNRGVITKLIKEAEYHLKQLDDEGQGKSDQGRMKTICVILSEKKDILKELD